VSQSKHWQRITYVHTRIIYYYTGGGTTHGWDGIDRYVYAKFGQVLEIYQCFNLSSTFSSSPSVSECRFDTALLKLVPGQPGEIEQSTPRYPRAHPHRGSRVRLVPGCVKRVPATYHNPHPATPFDTDTRWERTRCVRSDIARAARRNTIDGWIDDDFRLNQITENGEGGWNTGMGGGFALLTCRSSVVVAWFSRRGLWLSKVFRSKSDGPLIILHLYT